MKSAFDFLIPSYFSNLKADRAVDAADAYRDRGNWKLAATFYGQALAVCPDRRAIWVQLGHAEKEAGDREAALAAYNRAAALPGQDGDAPLHLGMLARQMGDMNLAKEAFSQAFREDAANIDVRRELVQMLNHPDVVSPVSRAKARRWGQLEESRLAMVDWSSEPGAAAVFDVSDLVSYFRHTRLPTGIQRVQMEVIRQAAAGDPRTQIGCFSDELHGWIRIPLAQFEQLCVLAVDGGDALAPVWMSGLEELAATLGLCRTVQFDRGGFLVNLGASWSLPNYFLNLREIQRAFGIHYVPFVHDFIPVVAPQLHIRNLTEDFLEWTLGVMDHADFFLVNSRSTKNDLHQVATTLGYHLETGRVGIIPLNADFRRNFSDDDNAEAAWLAQWAVKSGEFVLFVATIEVRKNHMMVFKAWSMLIARHGVESVPDLVCVGHPGWLNDRIYAMLEKDPILASKVRMLSHLSDRQLGMLYRRCSFTVYPSLYEGWGLPVTESLCYGKVPIVARASSLPEAGGDFAIYIEPDEPAQLAAHVERLSGDAVELTRLEKKIAHDFSPRAWSDIVLQIHERLRHFAQEAAHDQKAPSRPLLTPGVLYHLARNRRISLVRGANLGELARDGIGWRPLEDWGCWTAPEGGGLAFRIKEQFERVLCYLRLRLADEASSGIIVTTADGPQRVCLAAGATQWVLIEVPVVDGEVSIHLRASREFTPQDSPASRDDASGLVGVCAFAISDARQSPDLLSLAHTMVARSRGAYILLSDLYQVLFNRPVDAAALEDYLPSLETQTLNRDQLVAILARYPEAQGNLAKTVKLATTAKADTPSDFIRGQ